MKTIGAIFILIVNFLPLVSTAQRADSLVKYLKMSRGEQEKRMGVFQHYESFVPLIIDTVKGCGTHKQETTKIDDSTVYELNIWLIPLNPTLTIRYETEFGGDGNESLTESVYIDKKNVFEEKIFTQHLEFSITGNEIKLMIVINEDPHSEYGYTAVNVHINESNTLAVNFDYGVSRRVDTGEFITEVKINIEAILEELSVYFTTLEK
ncbi:hypothetical protein COB64_00385 [Candidatus Wolfebacteria bacterium]|nr:MAG: hypothetical protein COB64_00385 [Candidatus Wolfebacteria bacterium]